MPIKFKLGKIEGWQDLYRGNTLEPFALSVIDATAYTGIPNITKKNYQEFWARLQLRNASREVPWVLLYDVKEMIGLTTDSKYLGKTAFLDLLVKETLRAVEGETEAQGVRGVSSVPGGEELRSDAGTEGPPTVGAGPRPRGNRSPDGTALHWPVGGTHDSVGGEGEGQPHDGLLRQHRPLLDPTSPKDG